VSAARQKKGIFALALAKAGQRPSVLFWRCRARNSRAIAQTVLCNRMPRMSRRPARSYGRIESCDLGVNMITAS